MEPPSRRSSEVKDRHKDAGPGTNVADGAGGTPLFVYPFAGSFCAVIHDLPPPSKWCTAGASVIQPSLRKRNCCSNYALGGGGAGGQREFADSPLRADRQPMISDGSR